jgi:integrase
MGGKLILFKRPRSRFWQSYTQLAGRTWRESTKEESLAQAKNVAEDWFLRLKGVQQTGNLKSGKKFREAAEQFLKEYEALTKGKRSPGWVELLKGKINKYLIPYFGNMLVSSITPGTFQEYLIYRAQNGYRGKPPGDDTIAHETSAFLHVMHTAKRHHWLEHVPSVSAPFKASRKIAHRAWFSPEEYRQLYLATRKRARNPKRKDRRWECEQLHDKVLFIANTGLRPDEASRLQLRDVQVIEDDDTGETILDIEVRGKTGVGRCKSMPGAVRPFERIKARNKLKPTDRLFPKTHRQLLSTILDELKLRRDRDGNRRTFYSLRHSYVCFRLMEGGNIHQIANNCRTSVEMIEKHYARHIRNRIDAALINVRRPKRPKHPSRDETDI